MNFDEWWNDQLRGAPIMVFNTEEEMARSAWDAAKEACASICESRIMGDNNREDQEAKRCADDIRSKA